MSQGQLREEISRLVAQYATEACAPEPFRSGKSKVPPAGKVLGSRELQLMVEASLDGWLTSGRFNEAFENKLGEFLGGVFKPHLHRD